MLRTTFRRVLYYFKGIFKMIINTDGGSRGNPGPSAIGIVIRDNTGTVVKEIGKYIGVGTNNEAEYKALVLGIETVIEKGEKDLQCYLDSELVVNQLTGKYKVKNMELKKFWDQIKILEKKLEKIEYTHVRREKNKEADAIVNQVLDSTH